MNGKNQLIALVTTKSRIGASLKKAANRCNLDSEIIPTMWY